MLRNFDGCAAEFEFDYMQIVGAVTTFVEGMCMMRTFDFLTEDIEPPSQPEKDSEPDATSDSDWVSCDSDSEEEEDDDGLPIGLSMTRHLLKALNNL